MKKLKALPVQLLDLPDGVLVKRGCTEFKITGEEARIVVETILGAATGEGATYQEICELFPLDAHPVVIKLIEQLTERRILVSGNDAASMKDEIEDTIDLFYWHFGMMTEPSITKLNVRRIAILGVTCIARQLVISLAALKLTNFEVIDYPFLRNLRLFDESGTIRQWPLHKQPLEYQKWSEDLHGRQLDCVIATSDFGYSPVLIEWNRFCVERNCHFFPVVLRNMIGYVGPLVIPGETACLECLRARQDSHMQAPLLQRASEQGAFEGQVITGFHPSMASILGDLAAFELSRFYTGIPRSKVGTLIEVDLLNTQLKARKVLKVPRCRACSPLNKRSSLTPYKTEFTRFGCDES